MAAKLKFGNVVLCEHVVEGAHNKHTLVNVFSGDIVLSAMPVALLLGLYIEYFAHKDGPIELDLEIMRQSKRLISAKVGAKRIGKGDLVTFVLPVIQVAFEEDTILEIVASAAGFRKEKILSKRVFKGPLPPIPST